MRTFGQWLRPVYVVEPQAWSAPGGCALTPEQTYEVLLSWWRDDAADEMSGSASAGPIPALPEGPNMTVAEPSVNDLNPMLAKDVKREPIALIDTSGSMDWPVAEGSSVKRRDVVGEAMGMLVLHLEDQDSEAPGEQSDGSDDKGGLLTFGFASDVTEFGDLNSSNWRSKWDSVQWGGGTQIMPAWRKAEEEYMEEFGDRSPLDRPVLYVLVLTDGEAADAGEFASVLEDAKAGRAFCVAIVGHGVEHDKTLRSYKAVEAKNPKRVRVVTFGGETDPKTIADGLISLVGE